MYFIKHHTAVLVEDGEAAMSKIQEKARETGCLLADILRMTEDYCKDLGNRAMLRELSIDLKKEREAERTTQLGAMEAEVSKLKLANKQGDMAVTRQLRWRMEASGWAASAACSHHPTACVGHSRGFTAIRTSYVGTKRARYTHARGRIITA